MSNPSDANETPIGSMRQLAEYLASGCKPASLWRIGTEHEKFGFGHATLAPPSYDGPSGIGALLAGVSGATGGTPLLDAGKIVGVKQTLLPGEPAVISLEPAGQFELSGAPLATVHDTAREMALHLEQVRAVAGPLGVGFAPLGFHPTLRRDEMPWMPKSRYAIMRRYMPLVGTLGFDMMLRTCTVQVNLDFESEADMRRKLRVALALQPLATALFANSPFTEGRPNGFMSYRAHVWTDTDRTRSGMPAAMFEPDFGFERHARWLVDEVPMYFASRHGRMVDVAGRSFADFIAGRVPELADTHATIGDFADHSTTAFTDVRLKRFIEMRGSDAGTPEMMVAEAALWVGLLYDGAALAAAEALTRAMSFEDVQAMRVAVPRGGLDAPNPAGGSLRDLARDVVAIAHDGLRARARMDAHGRDETIHLAPLQEIAAGGPVQAQHWLQRYETAWGRDVRAIFAEAAV